MLTLIQFNPDERTKPQTFHLSADQPHVIGRRNGEVQLLDTRISRQHAEVSVQNGTWVIRDLNSSNGTWVNGDRVEGLCELEEGDRLVVGRVTLIVGHVAVDETEVGITMPAPPTESETEAPALPEPEAEPTLEADAPEGLDLEADIELEPIDFDGVIDEEPPQEPSEPDASADEVLAVSPESDEVSSPTQDEADLLDLSNESEEDAGLSASSLGPTLAAPPESELEAGLDEPGVEDEYAATMDFVTPTTRPNSPLDDSDAPSELPEEQGAASADDSDDAPPVVGLSLDMPGPSDEPGDDRGDEDHALEESLEASLELSDLPGDDDANDDTADPQAAADDKPAEKTPAYVEERTGPDWVESEEQQELSPEWSSNRGSSGKKKALIALVLLALAGGGAYWAINTMQSDTTTAVVSPGDGSAAPAGPVAQAPPTQTQASTPPTPKPQTPAVAPPVEVAEADETLDVPKSNAFGQAPTLTTPPPQITPPKTTPTPPAVVEAPTQVPAEEPAPTDTTVEATRVDTPEVPEPPAVPTETDTNSGAAVAALDPPAANDAQLTPVPTEPAEAETPPPPAIPVEAQRLVFVIDASGSMVDSMNQGALSWLEQRLALMSDHDQFAVLFFRDNEVIEVPPMGMKPGDSLSREHALAWVAPDAGHVRPRGKSEPLNALQQALQYGPTDLFILSDDKFGQRKAAAAIDVRDLESLLGDQKTLIHTVQFFYPSPEDRRLEAIAKRFGGTYEFVEEPPFDINPGDNLGVDLLGISR
ncbi:FHA domain-containing protein [Algisphaera agarilytica]|uniref:FHA domain-containing protein n=1 Tax=Algisphaera agarilytica TaxID=1385975 RepID=A0A7X0H414_9BACT|nr:FHA domain-containing protein [Algisphaera agarilytica]MBB6428855.1 hypothetical protein [Algisphaera agarilytica]